MVALVLLGIACGGGGGGGGGGGPTQPPLPSLVYTPAGAAANGSVALVRANGADPTTLVLEVRVREVAGLYGAAFDLTFPETVLRFDTASEGTFLSAGGAATAFQVAPAGTGSLVVGISRLGSTAGVASGEGLLLSLRFTAIAAGTGNLGLSANRAYDSAGGTLAAQWLAGAVTVTR
jgi:hypothetical protein